MPEQWVKVFPTIQFETSARNWQTYEGWQNLEHFAKHYEQFNPPPRSNDATSPFKEFATNFPGSAWSFPGKIADHLLDPNSLHKFSEYEIRNLAEKEMINLHSAHHEDLIEPGRKVTSQLQEVATGASSANVSTGQRRVPSLFRRRRFR
jgi:hypothetical protein